VVSIERQRIAVFGNAGGGKSTLSRQLAEITGLPLYVLDLIQFPDGQYRAGEQNGGKLSPEDYLKVHAELIEKEQWIIDGYGSVSSAWERFNRADTLVYVDLPLRSHYWGVTKRFLKGLIKNPRGWPEKSPLLASTLDSYRVVGLCHRNLTPKYRTLVGQAVSSKRVYHLRSRSEVREFVRTVLGEHSSRSTG
jgi:adenylate kinase family enzyme